MRVGLPGKPSLSGLGCQFSSLVLQYLLGSSGWPETSWKDVGRCFVALACRSRGGFLAREASVACMQASDRVSYSVRHLSSPSSLRSLGCARRVHWFLPPLFRGASISPPCCMGLVPGSVRWGSLSDKVPRPLGCTQGPTRVVVRPLRPCSGVAHPHAWG